jgi:hypothetical protein
MKVVIKLPGQSKEKSEAVDHSSARETKNKKPKK